MMVNAQEDLCEVSVYVSRKTRRKVFKRRSTKGVNLYTEGNFVVVIVLTTEF